MESALSTSSVCAFGNLASSGAGYGGVVAKGKDMWQRESTAMAVVITQALMSRAMATAAMQEPTQTRSRSTRCRWWCFPALCR